MMMRPVWCLLITTDATQLCKEPFNLIQCIFDTADKKKVDIVIPYSSLNLTLTEGTKQERRAEAVAEI